MIVVTRKRTKRTTSMMMMRRKRMNRVLHMLWFIINVKTQCLGRNVIGDKAAIIAAWWQAIIYKLPYSKQSIDGGKSNHHFVDLTLNPTRYLIYPLVSTTYQNFTIDNSKTFRLVPSVHHLLVLDLMMMTTTTKG